MTQKDSELGCGSSFIVFLKKNLKGSNFNANANPIWVSVSVLAIAVIAILEFVRGAWLPQFLSGVFSVWNFSSCSCLLGVWLALMSAGSGERCLPRAVGHGRFWDAPSDVPLTLFHHVNYRITLWFKSTYCEQCSQIHFYTLHVRV